MVSGEVSLIGDERVFLSMYKKIVLTYFNTKLTWSLLSVCKVIFVKNFVPLAFLFYMTNNSLNFGGNYIRQKEYMLLSPMSSSINK
jgi:hypothetical protein